MSSGFASVHPIVEQALRQLDLTSTDVTQGVGYAAASAGFHEPVGECPRGRLYGPCVDLSWRVLDGREPQAVRDHLLASGAVPFFRCAETGWANSRHIHCVWLGLEDWQGVGHLPAGPRQQIVDATRGLNGLAGHAPQKGPAYYWPDAGQRERIAAQYEAWAPDIATRVYNAHGDWIPCYAFLAGDTVRVEARPLAEALGGRVKWGGIHFLLEYGGAVTELSATHPRVEGWFTRCDLRPLAEALGRRVVFEWGPDHSYCVVRLLTG